MWVKAFKEEIKLAFMTVPFHPDGDREPVETDSSGIDDADTPRPPFQPYSSTIRNLPTYALKNRMGKLQKQMSYVKAHKSDYSSQDVNELHGKITPVLDELRHRGYEYDKDN